MFARNLLIAFLPSAMLGLALVPPLWLLALVAPLLLWTHRRRTARRGVRGDRGLDPSPPDPRDAP